MEEEETPEFSLLGMLSIAKLWWTFAIKEEHLCQAPNSWHPYLGLGSPSDRLECEKPISLDVWHLVMAAPEG